MKKSPKTKQPQTLAIFYALASRYGDKRIIRKEGTGVYTIEGRSKWCRVGNACDGKGLEYIDFEGGPMVGVGGIFPYDGAEQTITKVEFAPRDKDAEKDWVKVRIFTDAGGANVEEV